MAGASFCYDSRIDAVPIISDAQLERISVIRDVRFDIARLCVAESISYRLTSYRIDLVPQDRMQVPSRALHYHMEIGGTLG